MLEAEGLLPRGKIPHCIVWTELNDFLSRFLRINVHHWYNTSRRCMLHESDLTMHACNFVESKLKARFLRKNKKLKTKTRMDLNIFTCPGPPNRERAFGECRAWREYLIQWKQKNYPEPTLMQRSCDYCCLQPPPSMASLYQSLAFFLDKTEAKCKLVEVFSYRSGLFWVCGL